MIWKPELQPNVKEGEARKLEWLVRSFRKLSQRSETVQPLGHGGLFLTAPIVLGTPITLTTSFQKITGFESVINENNVGTLLDLSNDRMAVSERGVWDWKFSGVGEITPFTGNVAQTIELAVYNETDLNSLIVGYHAVPRYSDVFSVVLSAQRSSPGPLADTGDFLSLWIRQRAATPVISINAIQELEISATRVA